MTKKLKNKRKISRQPRQWPNPSDFHFLFHYMITVQQRYRRTVKVWKTRHVDIRIFCTVCVYGCRWGFRHTSVVSSRICCATFFRWISQNALVISRMVLTTYEVTNGSLRQISSPCTRKRWNFDICLIFFILVVFQSLLTQYHDKMCINLCSGMCASVSMCPGNDWKIDFWLTYLPC